VIRKGILADERNVIEWFTSLPFVEVLSATGTQISIRRVVVDCEPLGVRALCGVVVETGNIWQPIQFYVVVPEHLRKVVMIAGWFSSMSPLPDGRCLCEVELVGRDRAELEVILGSVYSFAFPEPHADDGQH
jgi:hypothetical protein